MFTRKPTNTTPQTILDAARKKHTVNMDAKQETAEKATPVSYQPMDDYGNVYSPYFHGYRSTYRV
ncbi:MAG: hypothetical protein KC546_13355 [Anaerolineae bacterium]|nr:hypothetical protein [Anaerolineae bacterium]MCA9889358.1 hypothetical protein [Anaerolineae bacterium]MCA9892995.1 hypothetical protein [Anaerolineae bacterium]